MLATKTTSVHPAIDLTEADVEAFGAAIDRLRVEVMASRGDEDAAYIRRTIKRQRQLAAGSRLLIYASLAFLPAASLACASWPLFWLLIGLGTLGLGGAKILENMEIGHNVMHGQWNWLHDPHIHSTTWEWDTVSVSDHWKQTHNHSHHTWTNVLGKDHDIGYGVMRMSAEQSWHPHYLLQPIGNLLLCLFFEWGNALQILDVPGLIAGRRSFASAWPEMRAIARKMRRQVIKDYLAYPLLAGPYFLPVLAANWTAGMIRNVWSNMVIFCGHFPAGVYMFRPEEVDQETRAEWYLRQLLGSCNIAGGPLLHWWSGNLSFQIEHHLFPDMPSNRYREVAPQVQALAESYGLPYHCAPFWRQYGTTTLRIWRYAFP